MTSPHFQASEEILNYDDILAWQSTTIKTYHMSRNIGDDLNLVIW